MLPVDRYRALGHVEDVTEYRRGSGERVAATLWWGKRQDGVELEDAMRRVLSLRNQLQAIADKDPEQEVQGIALPVLDVVLTEASRALPAGDPVIEVSRGLITPETIEAGEPMRAVDVAVVADQLYQALKQANRFNAGPLIG